MCGRHNTPYKCITVSETAVARKRNPPTARVNVSDRSIPRSSAPGKTARYNKNMIYINDTIDYKYHILNNDNTIIIGLYSVTAMIGNNTTTAHTMIPAACVYCSRCSGELSAVVESNTRVIDAVLFFYFRIF